MASVTKGPCELCKEISFLPETGSVCAICIGDGATKMLAERADKMPEKKPESGLTPGGSCINRGTTHAVPKAMARFTLHSGAAIEVALSEDGETVTVSGSGYLAVEPGTQFTIRVKVK